MQVSIAQSQTICVIPDPTGQSLTGAKMVAQGRQLGGSRFMLGIVSLGDAAREGLRLASLETSSSVPASTKITDASGRTFVAPTPDSIKAAAAQLKPDKASNTFTFSYDTLRSSAPAAYPGTMVVYAAVPTSGLSPSLANDYSQLISFAAGAGQTPGTGQGKLPDGFLPMTSANGLGSLAAFSSRAATAVVAQHGEVPSVTGSGDAVSARSTTPGGNSAGGGGEPSGGSAGGSSGSSQRNGGSTPSSPTTSIPASSTTSATTSSVAAGPVGFTKKLTSGFGGLILPLLVAIALAAGGGAAFVQWQSKAMRK
jgi:hypothetical protein